MKILLFGAYANGNIGDELQAESLARTIREVIPDARFTANSHFQRDFHFTLGEKAPFGSILDLDFVNSHDRLVIGGGGLFSHPHEPLADEAWAEGLRVPVIIWGVGASDFFAGDARKLIAKASFASGRDIMSVKSLARYRADVPFVCDPVLADTGTDIPFDAPAAPRSGTLWVLRGPLTKVHDKVLDYLKPGDKVVGFEPAVDAQIESLFPQITYPETIERFSALAATSERVISMRFHGIILALNAGIPVAALDVGKGLDLLKILGLPKRVITGEEWNVEFDTSQADRTKAVIASIRQFYRLQLGIALRDRSEFSAGTSDWPGAPDLTKADTENDIVRLLDRLMPADLLGFAHRQAKSGRLALATILAESALARADELGEGQELSARVLTASLLERQGRIEEASRMITLAVQLAPDDENVRADQERIRAARIGAA